MKVLTIKEPWATLIAEGIKEYEFRTWKTNYRGEILIHAGKTRANEYPKIVRKYPNFEYMEGFIIAEVTISDCIKVDKEFINYLKKKNAIVYENIINSNNIDKLYAFKITNVRKIIPKEAIGHLNFWQYDFEYNYVNKK